jgi:hypothetical protein
MSSIFDSSYLRKYVKDSRDSPDLSYTYSKTEAKLEKDEALEYANIAKMAFDESNAQQGIALCLYEDANVSSEQHHMLMLKNGIYNEETLIGRHTKSSFLASCVESYIRYLESLEGSHVVPESWKLEKLKWRPLIGFGLAGYVQFIKIAHEIEQTLTTLIPSMHMEGSPGRVCAIFFKAMKHFRECECEAFMGDLAASDSQYVKDRQKLYYQWWIEVVDEATADFEVPIRDKLRQMVRNYVAQSTSLVVIVSFMSVVVFLKQWGGVRTGAPTTKDDNTVPLDVVFKIAGKAFAALKIYCERHNLKVNFKMPSGETVQGDDTFCHCHNVLSRLLLLKVFEMMNVKLKAVQSPGVKGCYVYLQRVTDKHGSRKMLCRAMQLFCRELATVKPDITQIILLNIVNFTKCMSRGAGKHLVQFCDIALKNMFKCDDKFIDFMKVSSFRGGLGLSYYEGGWFPEERCSPYIFREIDNHPEVDCEEVFDKLPMLKKYMESEVSFYKANNVKYPISRKLMMGKMGVMLIHWSKIGKGSKTHRSNLHAYLSTFESKPAYPYDKNEQVLNYVKRRILDLWDPNFEKLKNYGESISFGKGDAINLLHLIGKGLVFEADFQGLLIYFMSAYKERGYPGKMTSGFVLEEAKRIGMSEEGFRILKELVVATGHMGGWAKFLYHIGEKDTGIVAGVMNKKQYMKVASMNDIRSMTGPGCNAIPPYMDEDIRPLINDFSRKVAWDLLTVSENYPITRLSLDTTRPTDYFNRIVRVAAVSLCKFRKGDLNITGKICRGIQLGILDVAYSTHHFIETSFEDVDGLSGLSEGPSGWLCVKQEKVKFMGDVDLVPGNVDISDCLCQDGFERPVARHVMAERF